MFKFLHRESLPKYNDEEKQQIINIFPELPTFYCETCGVKLTVGVLELDILDRFISTTGGRDYYATQYFVCPNDKSHNGTFVYTHGGLSRWF
jgi:hypothetical protein